MMLLPFNHMILQLNNPCTKFVLGGFFIFGCLAQPAFSQRDYDPNLNHFYMGRQIWTVEDNSPIINNSSGTAPGGMNGNGALAPRAPLPKAGWQGYAPIDNPAANANNKASKSHGASGTKPASHSISKSGQKGHAGNLSSGGSSSAIKGYQPYATYSNPANAPSPSSDLNSSTHVKGSLLHWARRSPGQQ